jgi:hypothetical protein
MVTPGPICGLRRDRPGAPPNLILPQQLEKEDDVIVPAEV